MSGSGDGGDVLWSETYRGHRIATKRDHRAWRVMFDDIVDANYDFDSAEEATAWLRRRVDDRIAEQIFPGLARR